MIRKIYHLDEVIKVIESSKIRFNESSSDSGLTNQQRAMKQERESVEKIDSKSFDFANKEKRKELRDIAKNQSLLRYI